MCLLSDNNGRKWIEKNCFNPEITDYMAFFYFSVILFARKVSDVRLMG